MKIRRLEIQGFKSFADRTSFEFGDGISSIVGPNGCGKSNVVDAIKWVLGDMSPRSLRGKRMEDVIFAGSRHRRALGLAEVTLVLDNEDGQLRTERSEVAITRRLHRSGQSEYLIGGDAARLKDIRELFFDTGLGVDGNAIMEQGQIDALLAANPQDRRSIFEEAAGISRYKQRRKEAEQRLGRTEENLERLLDVLELEEKRLRSLKNQAGRARRYTEIREELLKKRVLRGVLRYRRVSVQREGLQAGLRAALEEETRVSAELEALEEETRAAEARRTEAREAVHAEEARIARVASDARAATDRAAFAARSKGELEDRIATARRQLGEAKERAERLAREIESLDGEAEEARLAAASHTNVLGTAEVELSRLEAQAARIRDAHEGAKREALAALGRIAQVRNAESERRVEIRQAEERIRRLGLQRADLVARHDALTRDLAELGSAAARMEEEGRAREAALGQAEVGREERVAAVAAARTRRSEASEARATCAARLEILERLAASHEGVDGGAQAVLAHVESTAPAEDGSRDGVFGLLADLVGPAPEDAAVLDRLLGPAAGAIVVRTSADALRWLSWLRDHDESARARFLALDLVRDDAAPLPASLGELGCEGRLLDLVRSVAEGVTLIDRLEEGVQLWRQGRVNAVTPRGDRVTASGALLGGADGVALGLVGRRAERRALEEEIAHLDGVVTTARHEELEAEALVREADETLRRLRADLRRHAEDRSRGGEALAGVERELGHVRRTLELHEGEFEELQDALVFTHEAAAILRRRLAAMEQERADVEARAEEAARGYVAIEAARGEAAEKRMEIRLALAEARARSESAASRVARGRDEVRQLEQRAEGLASEAEELGRRLGAAEVEITEAEALAAQREEERRAAGACLVQARQRLAALEGEAGSEDAKRHEVQRLHEDLRRRLEGIRLKDSELRVRMETLIEQVQQDHGLDLTRVAAETEADDDVDLDAVDEEVEQLRQRLEGLGNVNLNAITELDEVQAHVDFLRAQEKDLLEAKADLASVIQELNEVSTTRFAETFEVVRENFRETFRRLFGGGRADIVLEDASNLLESGVDIVARPPGKEQRTISLLSGGERTLTAVALLFAVFKAKPSPFAILDEVDAALDEANVRRLIALVREFTDRSQFLVVTHAKTTMEAADLLYGVTMEEPGVSRKVAVRLTEYPAEAVAAG